MSASICCHIFVLAIYQCHPDYYGRGLKLLTRMMMGLMFCVFLFGMDGAHGHAGDKVLQVSNKKEGEHDHGEHDHLPGF